MRMGRPASKQIHTSTVLTQSWADKVPCGSEGGAVDAGIQGNFTEEHRVAEG